MPATMGGGLVTVMLTGMESTVLVPSKINRANTVLSAHDGVARGVGIRSGHLGDEIRGVEVELNTGDGIPIGRH